MSDVAIRVQGLGKQYRLGGPREQYSTIRDQFWKWAFLGGLPRRANLTEHSPPFWALKDVSFEVIPGEVVGIIGRNGAGKSTLLKILSRITEPTEGSADIHGRVGSLLEVGTGFHPELTGRENVYLNGAIMGMKRAEIVRKFDEIVTFAEVEKFIDTPVKHYSSGMYMRLAFAVAAHLEPEILIVDEILAVGDAEFQKKCLGRMSEISKQGRTVLFVSHNLQAIRQLCQSVAVLQAGRLLLMAPAQVGINEYINISVNFPPKQTWTRTDQPDQSLIVRRLSAQLTGVQPHVVLILDLDVATLRPHKPAFVAFNFHDYIGTVFMQAIPTVEPFLNANLRNRTYRAEVELPPLIPGCYSLSVWVGSHNTETLDAIQNCIMFEIHESPTPGRTYPHHPSAGMIVPISHIHLVDSPEIS